NKLKKLTPKQITFYIILAICFVGSIVFVYNNYSFYERPIAKVIETNVEEMTDVTDAYENEDQMFTQSIIAKVKNGDKKGEVIHLTNEYSASGAYDQPYEVGSDVFVTFDKREKEEAPFTGSITDVKRDKYIV